MSALPADLTAFVARRFAATDRAQAVSLLETATIHDGTRPSDQLLRCAAVASRGDLAQLRDYVALLKLDWRDVIVAGEYARCEGRLERVRDLTLPLAD